MVYEREQITNNKQLSGLTETSTHRLATDNDPNHVVTGTIRLHDQQLWRFMTQVYRIS